MIKVTESGSFDSIVRSIKGIKNVNTSDLTKYADRGLKALQEATPKDTGLTASSWSYSIVNEKGNISITYTNSNNQNGVNIAIILQYGHATRNGYFVEGQDYINPALKPVFDDMANNLWKEVSR